MEENYVINTVYQVFEVHYMHAPGYEFNDYAEEYNGCTNTATTRVHRKPRAIEPTASRKQIYIHVKLINGNTITVNTHNDEMSGQSKNDGGENDNSSKPTETDDTRLMS